MAKVKLDPLFVEIRGTMGNLVFKKSRRGETIITRRPCKSNTPPSEANRYARTVLAEPDLRAAYEDLGAREGKGAFAAARDAYLTGRA